MSTQKTYPLIAFGNEAPVLPADSLKPGIGGIAMANESSFNAGTFTQALTAFAVGWSDTNPLKETVDYIAPEVPVDRKFEFKKALNAEAFLAEDDDERAIGSHFKRVEYNGESALGKTKNRGLVFRMDMDDEKLTEEQVTKLLTLRIYRGKLRRAITALLAIAANTAKTWDGSAQPVEDMKAALAAAQLASGVFPNRGIMGLVPWNLLGTAYASQANAGAFAGLGKTPKEIGQLVGLDDLRIDKAVYQDTSTAKKRIVENFFVAFSNEDVISKDDPSHLKQFVSNGGLKVHRTEVGVKFVDITVEHYESIIATSDVGAVKLTIS